MSRQSYKIFLTFLFSFSFQLIAADFLDGWLDEDLLDNAAYEQLLLNGENWDEANTLNKEFDPWGLDSLKSSTDTKTLETESPASQIPKNDFKQHLYERPLNPAFHAQRYGYTNGHEDHFYYNPIIINCFAPAYIYYDNSVCQNASLTPPSKDIPKRKRQDDPSHGNKRQKIIVVKKLCKSPVMRALLLSVQVGEGGTFTDREKGKIWVHNFNELLDNIDDNCCKNRPTNDPANRVKTLQRWFIKIPGIQERKEPFELIVNKKYMDKYQDIFERPNDDISDDDSK